MSDDLNLQLFTIIMDEDESSGTSWEEWSASATAVRVDEALGENWQEIIQDIQLAADPGGFRAQLLGIHDWDASNSVPYNMAENAWVTDTLNLRYPKKYVNMPKFRMHGNVEAQSAFLPTSGVSFYRERIKDIDDEESEDFILYYPLSEHRHPKISFLQGTGQELKSSDTEKYIDDYFGGEGDLSNTLSQDPSLVGGWTKVTDYTQGEHMALAERFGGPLNTSVSQIINETINSMVRDLMNTTVRYGYTFRKIYEGDLEDVATSNPIFGEEAIENIEVQTLMGLTAAELAASEAPSVEGALAAEVLEEPGPGDYDA